MTLGVETATPRGGTDGRTAAPAAGLPVDRPAGATVRRPMDRQVRLVAGALVLVGFLAGLVRPPAHRLSGLVGAGLFFSGATGTCGMAVLLAPLPYDRPPTDARPFEETPARPAPA
ncbi:DUF2892 domain-containing protein [Streptomyces antibioticus]|uniref:YgaP family membrane protein n=1 Tax=Streptomyces antibioticus TaxID=1890 RepID=UPI0036B78FE1